MTEALSETIQSDGDAADRTAPPFTDQAAAPEAPPAPPAGVAGHDTAMTLWTPMRWWGVPLMRFVFFVVRHTGLTLPMLRRLSFIDYARWAIVRKFPRAPGSPRRRRDPRRRHHMLFESNFNGDW